ncbi:MAG: DUF2497 domain-containing protein [Sphingopyxis sp.]
MGDMTREPSMEEILSSIRRVIARDEDALGTPSADTDTDDTLELTATAPDVAPAPILDEDDAGTPADTAAADALVSDISAQASRQSLDALSAALSADPTATTHDDALPSGDMTLNTMVDAMLRPMLKSWLDTHLPPMVERLVAREIARITGNRF